MPWMYLNIPCLNSCLSGIRTASLITITTSTAGTANGIMSKDYSHLIVQNVDRIIYISNSIQQRPPKQHGKTHTNNKQLVAYLFLSIYRSFRPKTTSSSNKHTFTQINIHKLLNDNIHNRNDNQTTSQAINHSRTQHNDRQNGNKVRTAPKFRRSQIRITIYTTS